MKKSITATTALTVMPAASTANAYFAFLRPSERSWLMSRQWLSLHPMLRALAVFARRTNEFDDLRHLEIHLVLDDFTQGNVRGAEIGDVGDKRPARASAAGIELADPPGNHVDEDVGVEDFFEGFFYKFGIHLFFF